jgi:hypothetical protein
MSAKCWRRQVLAQRVKDGIKHMQLLLGHAVDREVNIPLGVRNHHDILELVILGQRLQPGGHSVAGAVARLDDGQDITLDVQGILWRTVDPFLARRREQGLAQSLCVPPDSKTQGVVVGQQGPEEQDKDGQAEQGRAEPLAAYAEY